MTGAQLVAVMVTAVVVALAALAAALSAFNRGRTRTGGALLVAAAAAVGLLLTAKLWPVQEPADCLFTSPYWVDGVETTRCVPGGDR